VHAAAEAVDGVLHRARHRHPHHGLLADVLVDRPGRPVTGREVRRVALRSTTGGSSPSWIETDPSITTIVSSTSWYQRNVPADFLPDD
jgi:hypothetical protein